MTVFVPNGENQGVTATWLLHSADENDIDRRLIKTTRGGFNVPDELAAAIGLIDQDQRALLAAIPYAPIDMSSDKTPPADWDAPLPTVDVYAAPDGKVYLTDEAFLRELTESIIAPVTEDPGFDAGRPDVVRDAGLAEIIVVPHQSALPPSEPPAEVDREVIRAWAKDNGLNPAEKGALKKAVLDAYAAAQIKE